MTRFLYRVVRVREVHGTRTDVRVLDTFEEFENVVDYAVDDPDPNTLDVLVILGDLEIVRLRISEP